MLGLRVDAALCLRSMRAYLHTIWFYTPRATRRIACQNLLLARPRVRRPAVENFVTRFFQPTLLPYPAPGKLPSDIEANRSVVSELLGREISDAEILPSLILPEPVPRSDRWLLCPFSSRPFWRPGKNLIFDIMHLRWDSKFCNFQIRYGF